MNPTVLSPASRFPLPHQNGLACSPSRSPNRQQFFMSHELDPLLSNLSPTSTLEALEATEAIDSEGTSGQSLLHDSVAAASTSERALGIRAALAGKKLKEWHRELIAWPWPESSQSSRNGFHPPSQEEKRDYRSKRDHEGCLDKALLEQEVVDDMENDEETEYWGGLPAQLVQDYERRVDMIRDDMEALGLEDLKTYVRDAHLTSNPRRLSRTIHGDGLSSTEYVHLDDFTAVITATIMHALPIISRLNSLLTTWSIRLLILRQIPGFLKLLAHARDNMAAAWNAIENVSAATAKVEFEIATTALHSGREGLERNIFELGRTIDGMLDVLEGREDTIPEEWIDGMETIEADFGSWVVESEKRVMEVEWRFSQSNHESVGQANHNNDSGVDKPEISATIHEDLQNTDIDEKGPSADIREPTNVYPLQPLPGLAAPFGFDGEVDGEEKQIVKVATLEFGGKALDMDMNPISDLKPTSQSESHRPHQMFNNIPRVSAVESFDTDSSHVITAQSEEEKHAVLGEVDDVATSKSPNPIENSSSTLEPSSLSSNISQATIIDQSGPFASTDSISNPARDQARERGDDLTENKPLKPEDAPSEPRTLEPLSMPDDISSLDISYFQLTKNLKKKGNTTPRPAPIFIKPLQPNMESTASSEMSSDTSVPGSGTSDYFSNMSSPEIQQASMAEYFENPVEVTTPSRIPSTPLDTFSRRSSLLTERGENGTNELVSIPSFPLVLNHRRRASSFAPGSSIPESSGIEDEKPIHRQNLRSHVRVRSASLRSFEIIPRREVRNVFIRRSDSYQSAVPGRTSLHTEDKSANVISMSQLPHSDTVAPTDPRVAKFTSPDKDADKDSDGQAQSELTDQVESGSNTFGLATPIESSPTVPVKVRHRFENVLDLSPGSTLAKLQRRKAVQVPVNSSARKGVALPPAARSLKNPEDQLEARISSILTEIPGHIRLKAGPEPDAPDVVPSDTSTDQKKPNSRSSAARSKKLSTSMSSSPLTLTPAHSKSSRLRGSSGDPEIKLYHLHQSGKDVPVKLFVRLVGEGGERVMVRIGGGWADLGEYLKEYASHHGRRSISDGRFEIQGLPQSQSNTPMSHLAGMSSPASSSISRPATPATRPGSRPDSRPGSRPGSSLSFRFPQHSAHSSADLDVPMTPENPIPRQFETMPGSTETSHSWLRPSSRLSSTDEESPLGLAGPKTRRKDVSPTKQAWVDEMVDQARKVSVEKKRGGVERDFGDLGTVGSTKRVFMRSRRDA